MRRVSAVAYARAFTGRSSSSGRMPTAVRTSPDRSALGGDRPSDRPCVQKPKNTRRPVTARSARSSAVAARTTPSNPTHGHANPSAAGSARSSRMPARFSSCAVSSAKRTLCGRVARRARVPARLTTTSSAPPTQRSTWCRYALSRGGSSVAIAAPASKRASAVRRTARRGASTTVRNAWSSPSRTNRKPRSCSVATSNDRSATSPDCTCMVKSWSSVRPSAGIGNESRRATKPQPTTVNRREEPNVGPRPSRTAWPRRTTTEKAYSAERAEETKRAATPPAVGRKEVAAPDCSATSSSTQRPPSRSASRRNR